MIHAHDFAFAAGERLHHIPDIVIRNFDVKIFNRFEQIAVGVAPKNNFRARDHQLVTFAPHLFHQDRNLHFATSVDFEAPAISVSLTSNETLVRVSRTSRSLIWRAVTNFPSRPANGESLTRIRIRIVGGSMSTNCNGARSSRSVSVSPIKISSKPVIPIMSPALACLISTRSNPL